jgi:hypothetical protein
MKTLVWALVAAVLTGGLYYKIFYNSGGSAKERTATAEAKTNRDTGEDAFSEARKKDTPEAHAEYLGKYPGGKHAAEARTAVALAPARRLVREDKPLGEIVAAYQKVTGGGTVPEQTVSAASGELKKLCADRGPEMIQAFVEGIEKRADTGTLTRTDLLLASRALSPASLRAVPETKAAGARAWFSLIKRIAEKNDVFILVKDIPDRLGPAKGARVINLPPPPVPATDPKNTLGASFLYGIPAEKIMTVLDSSAYRHGRIPLHERPGILGNARQLKTFLKNDRQGGPLTSLDLGIDAYLAEARAYYSEDAVFLAQWPEADKYAIDKYIGFEGKGFCLCKYVTFSLAFRARFAPRAMFEGRNLSAGEDWEAGDPPLLKRTLIPKKKSPDNTYSVLVSGKTARRVQDSMLKFLAEDFPELKTKFAPLPYIPRDGVPSGGKGSCFLDMLVSVYWAYYQSAESPEIPRPKNFAGYFDSPLMPYLADGLAEDPPELLKMLAEEAGAALDSPN